MYLARLIDSPSLYAEYPVDTADRALRYAVVSGWWFRVFSCAHVLRGGSVLQRAARLTRLPMLRFDIVVGPSHRAKRFRIYFPLARYKKMESLLNGMLEDSTKCTFQGFQVL